MAVKQILVCLNLRNEHARGVLKGIRAFAAEAGHGYHLEYQPDAGLTPEALDMYRPDGVVGFINRRQATALLHQRGLPAVNLDKNGLRRGETTVQVDEDALARLAVDHLLDRGYSDFGYVWYRTGLNVLERGRAFQRRVEAVRREDPGVTLGLCGLCRDLRAPKLDRFLRELPKPAGVLVFNDAWAAHVIAAAADLGLAVPEDVGVLGVDDDEITCCAAQPTLSSVPLPGREIGYRAMVELEALMDGGSAEGRQVRVPPVAVEPRASTELAACEDLGVAKALRYIRDHAHRGIDVGDVMATQTCSRPSFEKRFRAQTGRSPLAMIRQHRVGAARQLLINTDWPLWKVAEHAGFASAAHLCTTFKQLHGDSPGAFRRSARRR